MTYATDVTTEADWAAFDQVRRIMVHDDVRGGYYWPAIGYWDRLGNTHCLGCLPETLERDDRGYPSGITSDNSAAISDTCDTCGVSLLVAALEQWTYDRTTGAHKYTG